MTITNITIGADRRFAMVSADTIAAPHIGPLREASPCSDVAADMRAIAEGRVGTGAAPDAEPVGFVSKVFSFPHLRMMMGGAGALAPVLAFSIAASATPPHISDVDNFAEYAPAPLKLIAQQSPALHFFVYVVGWVPPRDRIAAYVFMSSDGFKKLEIGPGHTMQPLPDNSCSTYSALYDAQPAALQGPGAERFHRILLRNQLRACRNGKYPAQSILGGNLIIARIDAAGISMKTIAESEL
jgi:hypothetical protein